jgi:hypothetical protein
MARSQAFARLIVLGELVLKNIFPDWEECMFITPQCACHVFIASCTDPPVAWALGSLEHTSRWVSGEVRKLLISSRPYDRVPADLHNQQHG